MAIRIHVDTHAEADAVWRMAATCSVEPLPEFVVLLDGQPLCRVSRAVGGMTTALPAAQQGHSCQATAPECS